MLANLLSPRREAVEQLLAGQHLLLLTMAGSHAYGLATPTSDVDYTGIFAKTAPKLWDVRGAGTDTLEIKVEKGAPADVTLHEVYKFCQLAIKGNPAILECLFGQPIELSDFGHELRRIKECFLHIGSLKPYFGYLDSQRRRLVAGQSLHAAGGVWNPKFACHMLRLAAAAAHLAKHGVPLVNTRDLPPLAYDLLVKVKAGEVDMDECLAVCDRWIDAARQAEREACLREAPDYAHINSYIVTLRRAL